MALKGDLASVDLAQVFQMLALNRKVGLFCVTAPDDWRALYFEPRGVGVYCDEQVVIDRILTQVSRSGRLEVESAQEIRAHAAERGGNLGDAMLASGAIDAEELDALVRNELEEQVFDLFFWTEANFEFLENTEVVEGRAGAVDPRFRYSVDSVIMEAARRIDEWALIRERIESEHEIFRVTVDSIDVEELDDQELALFDLVDGKRSVGRLVEMTGASAFQVFRSMTQLLDDGLIEPVPAEELVPLAQECVAEARHGDALNLYERALDAGPLEDAVLALEEAAEVCLSMNEFERAGRHWKQLAGVRAESGDELGAITALQRTVEILPTDLGARERIVELATGRKDLGRLEFDPIAAGRELVDLYLAADDVERVRGILEHLLEENPKDVELKKILVNVYSRANDPRRVVELYESIADDLVSRREPIEAIKYLQKIVMIDRSRRDVSDRIRSLYVMDERSRNRRKSALVVLSILILVTGLGVGWTVYNSSARDAFSETDQEVERLIESGQFGEARALCEAFSAKYPFTLVLRDVTARVATVDSLERQAQQAADQRASEARTRLADLRDDYEKAYELYKGLLEADRLERALSQLHNVLRMVETAGEARDSKWALDNQIEEQIRGLEQRLQGGRLLRTQSDEALAAGDWQRARSMRIEVLEKYSLTPSARGLQLPVRVITRPAGAHVYRIVEGRFEELGLTPCTIELPHDRPIDLQIARDGFEQQAKSVDARREELVDVVMEIRPFDRLLFSDPVRGEITLLDDGQVIAGLRGGRIGFGRLDSDDIRFDSLPGLDEFHGRAVASRSQVFVVTREGRIRGYDRATAEQRWESKLPTAPLYDPLLRGSRMILYDESGRLRGYDIVGRPSPVWTRDLGRTGNVVAAPQLEGSAVWVLTSVDRRGGGLTAYSAQSGDQLSALRVSEEPTGVFHVGSQAAIVATADGALHALRLANGSEIWHVESRDGATFDFIDVNGESVYAATTTGEALRISLRSGEIEARTQIEGRIVSGPVWAGERIVWMIELETSGVGLQQRLIALDVEGLDLFWEYSVEGRFSSAAVQDGDGVLVADDSGQIVRLR